MSNFKKIIILGEKDYILGVNYKHYSQKYTCREILVDLNVTNYMYYQLFALNKYLQQIKIEKFEERLTQTPLIMISNEFRMFIRDLVNRQVSSLTREEESLIKEFNKLYFSLISCIRVVNLDKLSMSIKDQKDINHINTLVSKCLNKINRTKDKNVKIAG